MDDEKLASIEARATAATEWAFDECDLRLDGSDGSTFALQGAMLGQTLVTLGDTYEGCNEDWTFLAHARADVPALVAEVRRLRAIIDSAERVCEAVHDGTLQPIPEASADDMRRWAAATILLSLLAKGGS